MLAQQAQKHRYDRGTKPRLLTPGTLVLVSSATLARPHGDPWQGPYVVRRVLGPETYEVQCGPRPSHGRRLHINDLKEWHARPEREECALAAPPGELREGSLPWRLNPETTSALVLDPALTPLQQADLTEVLAASPGVFSQTPGLTQLVTHRIPTPAGEVYRARWRPTPQKRWEVIGREVREMLNLGVIEPSDGAWRSPVVLVPKPDGSIWFCVDYRGVNALAKFDAYPMPKADILIDQLGTARYLSAPDLTKGYWQVPMHPPDREKTAFATPQGLYQFTRMPFGLHGTAATFQRLVDRALAGCETFARAYIDGIIICSATWEDHLNHLRRVLQALHSAGLRANPTKSRLGFTELKYLGFLVGRGCLRPLPDKVEALAQQARPTTNRQLQRFLGFVGYYSRFIPGFASIASPLTNALQKTAPTRVQWGPREDHAFERLHTSLQGTPVLRSPDFAKPFVVQTDASGTGLGHRPRGRLKPGNRGG